MTDDLKQVLARGAQTLAQQIATKPRVHFIKSVATVAAINQDGTLNVNWKADTFARIPATTACKGVKVGDSVLIEFIDNMAFITGVIAKSSLA